MGLGWVTETRSRKALNFRLKCLVSHSESDEDPLKDAILENPSLEPDTVLRSFTSVDCKLMGGKA